MSRAYIPKALRQRVAESAGHRCGYCLTPEWVVGTPMEIDHIVPEALDGTFIVGQTPTGRATIIALHLNRASLVKARQLWAEAGWHPPEE